jgi:hypothetical protein
MLSKKRFNDRSKGPKHLASVSMELTMNKQARGRYWELPEGWGVQVQPEAGCGQKISKCPLKSHLSLDDHEPRI